MPPASSHAVRSAVKRISAACRSSAAPCSPEGAGRDRALWARPGVRMQAMSIAAHDMTFARRETRFSLLLARLGLVLFGIALALATGEGLARLVWKVPPA